ncbi:hypothetical protein MCEMIE11_00811 [Burkholderiales bacterium]
MFQPSEFACQDPLRSWDRKLDVFFHREAVSIMSS